MFFMDINQIRRQNARLLASQFKTLTGFADTIGRSQTYVSRFMGKNPTKGIGSKIARHIESSFDKPHGWLDTPHDTLDDNNDKEQPNTSMLKVTALQTDESGKCTEATSFTLLNRIVELEEKARELQEQAQLQQFRMEKLIAKEFKEHIEKTGSKVKTNVYKNSYDLIDHPSWQRVTLHIPQATQPIVIYLNELKAINPDAVIIAIPDAFYTLFYALPKENYLKAAKTDQPLPGIQALTFDVAKKTVNQQPLSPWGIFNNEPDGWF